MRYKMVFKYDGAFFHGFQRQTSLISVQELLEEKLSLIFKHQVIVNASGRTDAGVHAIGQVAHFDSEQLIPVDNLRKVLNKHIYPHVYVTDISFVDNTFHARKSAILKEYHYKVSINQYDPFLANYMHFFHDRIDIFKIREAMEYIKGEHDFKSFSKSKVLKSTIRTITSFTLDVKDGVLEFRIIGDGFMYNMVRIIVALMLKVGEGRLKPIDIKTIIEKENRKAAPFVAPPNGLYLYKVYYNDIYNERKEY